MRELSECWDGVSEEPSMQAVAGRSSRAPSPPWCGATVTVLWCHGGCAAVPWWLCRGATVTLLRCHGGHAAVPHRSAAVTVPRCYGDFAAVTVLQWPCRGAAPRCCGACAAVPCWPWLGDRLRRRCFDSSAAAAGPALRSGC